MHWPEGLRSRFLGYLGEVAKGCAFGRLIDQRFDSTNRALVEPARRAASTLAALEPALSDLARQSRQLFGELPKKSKTSSPLVQYELMTQVIQAVLAEHIYRQMRGVLLNKARRDVQGCSHLLAHPSGWLCHPGGLHLTRAARSLDSLPAQSLTDLFGQGWARVPQFTGHGGGQIFRELELLQFDGAFRQHQYEAQRTLRTHRTFVLNLQTLEGNPRFPGLNQVLHQLVSLPFELNKKVPGLLLHASHSVEIRLLDDQAEIPPHSDEGTGRVLTSCFIPRGSTSGGVRQLHLDPERVPLRGDDLLLWDTRRTLSVPRMAGKAFYLFFWMSSERPLFSHP